MHNQNQTPQVQVQPHPESAAALVLRLGRNLQRAAESESLAIALPVLRRLLATATLTAVSLPELARNRDIIQRKHLLRMLAVEAGFKCWEEYRHALNDMDADDVGHYDQLRRSAGYPNLWFSTYAEAENYARDHSGRALRVGSQAVVLMQ